MTVEIRGGHSAADLRALAVKAKDPGQARRLLCLAHILDGESRGGAARLSGVDRQAVRHWVLRYNADGPGGLATRTPPGRECFLSAEQLAELKEIVGAGPDRKATGLARWRRCDLRDEILRRFDVKYHPRTIGKILRTLGFAHISARPQSPASDPEKQEAFKKTSRTW